MIRAPLNLLFLLTTGTHAFILPQASFVASTKSVHRRSFGANSIVVGKITLLRQTISDGIDDEEEDESKDLNPYADPNYPDLEFVNYADPEYAADRGGGDDMDELMDSEDETSTEEQIEAMRETRRRKNDEFQFQTYFTEILKKGESEYFGEWTVYKTSTFLDNADDLRVSTTAAETDKNGSRPRLFKTTENPILVVSKGSKYIVDELLSDGMEFPVDAERILHSERIHRDENDRIESSDAALEEEILANTYWPETLTAFDFRGQQGTMVCGNAYTICKGVPMDQSGEAHVGPFQEYRAELGIQADDMRLRIKFDYSVLQQQQNNTGSSSLFGKDASALHLKSMTVCREALDMWPRVARGADAAPPVLCEALFGEPIGAPGGLYDPPPIGSDEQASQYMMLDLEGGATVLFPYIMDQDDAAHDGRGWVTTLDWCAGKMRYQVDRKVNAGRGILGLRTLELSEVQAADADTYRPRDGGQNMRQ